jgi:nicotinate-nucleotide adenylyltransferase
MCSSPRLAIRRLKLDQLWWMVTPGNPLKDTSGLPPLAERIAWSEAINNDPRVKITGFRGGARRPVYRRYARDRTALQSGRPLRLDHGRRQSGNFTVGRTGATSR